MIIALIFFIALAFILSALLFHYFAKTATSARSKKLRIERELHRAEFRLHEIAGEAFAALLDAVRSDGPIRPEK